MAIEYTEEQKKVINLHNRNILVSAAAGSGKTAVLVERIVRMVCREDNPVDIDRLLVVTFTNAAAAEMRERISQGIGRELACHPESDHLQRQAALLHNAQITTIDSFCMYLLKNHFHEIGVDPAFRIVDEGEEKLLKKEVLDALLEDAFARGDEAFLRCVEVFCPGGREQVLEENILKLNDFAQSYPWPEKWLAMRREDYARDSSFVPHLLAITGQTVAGCVDAYRQLQRICQEPDGPYMYGELIDRELEELEALLAVGDGSAGELTKEQAARMMAEYACRLPAFVFGRLSGKRDDTVSGAKREYVKELRSRVKNILEKCREQFWDRELAAVYREAACCNEPVNELVKLVLMFRERLQECKAQRKLVNFSDVEHYALDILLREEDGRIVPTQTAREYRSFYREILIDEYQDSNLVQEYLLKAVSGEEDGCFNRFMVGDVKQSIYKFRLARPELFLEKYEAYSTKEGLCQRIDLAKNFRSRPQVVDTVNGIFGRIMTKNTGGLVYDERAALYVGADYYPEASGCESELLVVCDKDGGSEELKRKEACMIALRIKELMRQFQVMDKDSRAMRPVRYSDMVILLRSGAGWDEVFKEVLEDEGVPAYVTSRTGYFAATEVQELMQLLRVIDNPRQDIPLFGVLKSCFGGFSEEELALLRSGRRGKLLYEALLETGSAEEEKDGALHEKVKSFLDKLERYRSFVSYLPIRELLEEVIAAEGYLPYVTALPMGGKRRANVEMLLTRASDFEKTSYHGLFHFIRYMEQLEKYDVDFGDAQLLDENADVVRIMSIHKSKGLEFPVVFVAGLAKNFNMQDVKQGMIIDVDMGIGVDYVDPVRRIRNKTLRKQVLARKMKEDNLAEEQRVLYVALTRAREKLIMTASVKADAAQWEEKYGYRAKEPGVQSDFSYTDFIGSSSYLDMVLPVAAGAGVRVLCPELSLPGEAYREQIDMLDKRRRLEDAGSLTQKRAYARLKESFGWNYPYEKLQKLYTKTTVSELKLAAMADKDEAAFHAFEHRDAEEYLPKFRRGEERISATVRGDAYHKVLELLDYEQIFAGKASAAAADAAGQGQQLTRFLDRMRDEGRLTPLYREAVSEYKLLAFLGSDLAERMHRAGQKGKLHREQPFVYGVDASRLGEGYPQGEKVLIQGIIDAYFEEADGLVLVDYKTDVVETGEELKNRYEMQLACYQEALEMLVGKPVKERLLYSFALGETVAV